MTRRFWLLAVLIALLVFGVAAQSNSQTPYTICGPDHPASEGHPCPTPPRAIFSPDPKYSEEARRKEIQGTVVLYLVVGADGRPSNIRVNRSLGYGLDEEAIAAVKRWRFEPSTVNGQPVPVKVSVEVNFRLYDNPKQVQVAQDISQGLLISKVQPTYPPLARQARVQGTVVLQAVIGKDGSVQELLTATQHKDEAIEVYRKWLKVDPSNRDAALKLSSMLSDSKKNADAIAVLENAIKLSPDSPSLQSALGYAYVYDKQTDKGIALLEQTLRSDAKLMAFNDAAYALADQNVHLDKAKNWGDKALQNLEAGSLKTQTEEGALKSTRDLGATWDTVGWIYFRMGEFEKAEAYLRAAFQPSQNAIVGDRLAQTYAKQGKKQEAAHTYRLAYAAAKGSDKNDIKQHYQELMGKSADPEEAPVTLKRGGRNDFGPEDELSRARTHKLSSVAHSSGSATFSVAFSPGKIDDVKVVSCDEKLKAMASEIASSKMRADFPNSDAVRPTRRGVLVCGRVGCDFTLLLPDSARATE